MSNVKSGISANLRSLRTYHHLSQEEVAERIGVTRQAVAKWENGDSLPDIVNCEALADLYDVSINDLIRHDPQKEGYSIGPQNKHIFGTVTMGSTYQRIVQL